MSTWDDGTPSHEPTEVAHHGIGAANRSIMCLTDRAEGTKATHRRDKIGELNRHIISELLSFLNLLYSLIYYINIAGLLWRLFCSLKLLAFGWGSLSSRPSNSTLLTHHSISPRGSHCLLPAPSVSLFCIFETSISPLSPCLEVLPLYFLLQVWL